MADWSLEDEKPVKAQAKPAWTIEAEPKQGWTLESAPTSWSLESEQPKKYGVTTPGLQPSEVAGLLQSKMPGEVQGPQEPTLRPMPEQTTPLAGRMTGLKGVPLGKQPGGEFVQKTLARAGALPTPDQPVGVLPAAARLGMAGLNLPFAAAHEAGTEMTGGIEPIEGMSPGTFMEIMAGAAGPIQGAYKKAAAHFAYQASDVLQNLASQQATKDVATALDKMGYKKVEYTTEDLIKHKAKLTMPTLPERGHPIAQPMTMEEFKRKVAAEAFAKKYDVPAVDAANVIKEETAKAVPRDMASHLGLTYNGVTVMKDGTEMHWITDPVTGSTAVIEGKNMTYDGIVKHINESRANPGWAKQLGFQPEPLKVPESPTVGVVPEIKLSDNMARVLGDRPEAPPTIIANTLAKHFEDIQNVFNPTMISEAGQKAARDMTAQLGRMHRSWERIEEALQPIKSMFNKMEASANFDFIDRLERGLPQSTPDLQRAADMVRKILDDKRIAVQALGRGYLENYNENYFPHLYRDPNRVERIWGIMMGRRPLRGPAEFLKKRTYPYLKDAMEDGKIPLSTNPVDYVMMKTRSMDRFIMGERLKWRWKQEGFAKFAKSPADVPANWSVLENVLAPRVAAEPESHIPFVANEGYDEMQRRSLLAAIDKLGIQHARVFDSPTFHGDQGVQGTSSILLKNIATRFGSSNGTLAHEIGHQVDQIFNLNERLLSNPQLMQEAMNLAMKRVAHIAEPAPEHIMYVTKPAEMMANLLEAHMHAPDMFEHIAPNLYRAYKEILASDPRLADLLNIKPSLVSGMQKLTGTVTAPGRAAGAGPQLVGRYYIPNDAARIVSNYLSPGLERFALYRDSRQVANMLNMAQLGLSGFHFGFTSADSMVSQVALGLEQLLTAGPAERRLTGLGKIASFPIAPASTYLKGKRVMQAFRSFDEDIGNPEMRMIVGALEKAGARTKMDSYYATNITEKMVQAFYSKNPVNMMVGGMFRLPFAGLEQAAKPIMQWLVPRQKLGVAYDLLHDYLKYHPKASVEELTTAAQSIWRSVDNRMGQLVYDNLFWNKVLKDMAMVSVRSVGWNIGTFRELGGGIGDFLKAGGKMATLQTPEFTHRMAYTLALPTTVGLTGAIYSYLRTGEAPKEFKDYFFWPTGRTNPDGSPERVDLPTYVRDAGAFLDDPIRTVTNKTNPLVSVAMDILRNKDFYNVKVWDPDDEFMKNLEHVAQYAGQTFTPFGIRYMEKSAKERGWDDMMTWLPGTVGVTPAPAYITQTKAYRMASEMQSEHFPKGAIKADEFDMQQLQRDYVARMRKTTDPAERMQLFGEMTQAIRDSKLAYGSGKRIAQRTMDAQPIAAKLRGLPVAELLKLYDKGDPLPLEREAIVHQLPKAFLRDRTMMSIKQAKDYQERISALIQEERRNAH